jgi:hypothetical protein
VLVFGAEVRLAGQPGGQPRGRVLVDQEVDAVGVGEPRDEVVRIAHVGDPDVRLPALEHPRPGADHRLDLLEVAELLDTLLGDDPGRGPGQQVQEPGVGLLEGELDGVLVERLDLVDVLERRLVGVAGDGEEALVGVLDVVGRQLPAVHRGLVVPAHALAQLEDVRGVVGLGPRLGEVALDRVRRRLDRRAGLHLHEPAVDEGQRHHHQERQRLVGIEVERVRLERQAQDAAPLRRLGGGRARDGRGHGERAARPEEVATREGRGGGVGGAHRGILLGDGGVDGRQLKGARS